MLGSFITLCKNTRKSHDFIWQLFKRDLFANYKKSALGYAWMILSPIIGVLSWVIMNSAGILKPGEVGVPYPAYVLTGTLMWGLLMGSYSGAAGTLTAGTDMIQQVKYPHEVLLIKQLAQQLVAFGINLLINLLVLGLLGVIPSWKIIFLPLVIIPMMLLSSALGLWAAMIGVVAPDITNAMNIGFGFIIYLVPVIYAKEVQNHYLAFILHWNPLTYLVCSARDVMLFGRLYGATGYFASTTLALFAFLFSLRCFTLLENRLIEKMA